MSPYMHTDAQKKNPQNYINTQTYFQRTDAGGIGKPLFSYTKRRDSKAKIWLSQGLKTHHPLGNKINSDLNTIPKTQAKGHQEGDKEHTPPTTSQKGTRTFQLQHVNSV